MNERETDGQLKLEYARRVLDSKRWLNLAEDLIDTIKALEPLVRKRWNDFDNMKGSVRSLMIQKTLFLLIGLAVENLLKSRIVKYNRRVLQREIHRTGKLPHILARTHNLRTYAQSAKISLTRNDQRILCRLSRAVRWSGRYPFPSSYKDWNSDNYSESDLDEMKVFVNELFAKLHTGPSKN